MIGGIDTEGALPGDIDGGSWSLLTDRSPENGASDSGTFGGGGGGGGGDGGGGGTGSSSSADGGSLVESPRLPSAVAVLAGEKSRGIKKLMVSLVARCDTKSRLSQNPQ